MHLEALLSELSGSASHYYDWPSENNSYFYSADEDRTWRSDRHIIIMDEEATVFDPEDMVPFDEHDIFLDTIHRTVLEAVKNGT